MPSENKFLISTAKRMAYEVKYEAEKLLKSIHGINDVSFHRAIDGAFEKLRNCTEVKDCDHFLKFLNYFITDAYMAGKYAQGIIFKCVKSRALRLKMQLEKPQFRGYLEKSVKEAESALSEFLKHCVAKDTAQNRFVAVFVYGNLSLMLTYTKSYGLAMEALKDAKKFVGSSTDDALEAFLHFCHGEYNSQFHASQQKFCKAYYKEAIKHFRLSYEYYQRAYKRIRCYKAEVVNQELNYLCSLLGFPVTEVSLERGHKAWDTEVKEEARAMLEKLKSLDLSKQNLVRLKVLEAGFYTLVAENNAKSCQNSDDVEVKLAGEVLESAIKLCSEKPFPAYLAAEVKTLQCHLKSGVAKHRGSQQIIYSEYSSSMTPEMSHIDMSSSEGKDLKQQVKQKCLVSAKQRNQQWEKWQLSDSKESDNDKPKECEKDQRRRKKPKPFKNTLHEINEGENKEWSDVSIPLSPKSKTLRYTDNTGAITGLRMQASAENGIVKLREHFCGERNEDLIPFRDKTQLFDTDSSAKLFRVPQITTPGEMNEKTEDAKMAEPKNDIAPPCNTLSVTKQHSAYTSTILSQEIEKTQQSNVLDIGLKDTEEPPTSLLSTKGLENSDTYQYDDDSDTDYYTAPEYMDYTGGPFQQNKLLTNNRLPQADQASGGQTTTSDDKNEADEALDTTTRPQEYDTPDSKRLSTNDLICSDNDQSAIQSSCESGMIDLEMDTQHHCYDSASPKGQEDVVEQDLQKKMRSTEDIKDRFDSLSGLSASGSSDTDVLL